MNQAATEASAAENTNQAGADTGAQVAGAEAGQARDTVLTGTAAVGGTAGVAEDGDKGAETGAGEGGETAGEQPDDAAKADGPPEKYEFTLPDGMAVDEQLASAVEPVFREIGLTNEQANKLAAKFAEWRVSEAQQASEAFAQQVEDWGKQAREDAEYGGAAFEKNVALAQRAIAEYGTPEFKALLQDGLGNHPELVRFCVRVGKAMAEDSGVEASTKTPPARSLAERLYDHPSSKHK